MLMVEIFAEFGEAHRGEALLIERIVVAPTQKAVQAEDEQWLYSGIVRTPHVGDVAGEFARSRVALSAEHANSLDFSLARRRWQTFGKHAHHTRILLRTAVASHNVIVQNRFEFPRLLLGHLGEVFAAVQTLLFTRNRQKNHCRRELELASPFAQNSDAFQAYRRPAAIIICSGRRISPI